MGGFYRLSASLEEATTREGQVQIQSVSRRPQAVRKPLLQNEGIQRHRKTILLEVLIVSL